MSITTIQEDASSYGVIRYFCSDRCINNKSIKEFNKNKIMAKELVTFDCGLMDMEEIIKPEIVTTEKNNQILAVIIRPEIQLNYILQSESPIPCENKFEFCGYDLVDISCYISAITNCGAELENAIDYLSLNQYGLIPSYKEAVNTQLNLVDYYPEHSHTYCEIIEIWRWLPN